MATKQIMVSEKTLKKIQQVSSRWDWSNHQSDGKIETTIMQALYTRLSWVLENVEHDLELEGIIEDTMDIVEALQKDIKI